MPGGASDLRHMESFMIDQGRETIMFEDMVMLTIYALLNAVIIMLTIFTWRVFRIEEP